MFFGKLLGLGAVWAASVRAVELRGYEYVVGANINYTVPAYHARVSEDEAMAWNFFVRHYEDDERQARDWKASYDTPDGDVYTGLNPPPGSKLKGVLYPRARTLGACTAHNAMVAVYPQAADFQYMATLTGDRSWSPENMRKYFERLERKQYANGLFRGHGKDGWLATELTPLSVALKDPQLLATLRGGAFALGDLTNQVLNVGTLLGGDLNADTDRRDHRRGFYQAPLSRSARPGIPGSATASREVIVAGGAYNSAQILKLSGVGTNLQDHYETAITAKASHDWLALKGCTFEPESSSSSSSSSNNDTSPATTRANTRARRRASTTDWWTWAILKSHPRNTAGRVTLRSADPLDVPDFVVFHCFDEGSGDHAADLRAMNRGRRAGPPRPPPPARSRTQRGPPGSRDQHARRGRAVRQGRQPGATTPAPPAPSARTATPLAVLDSKFRVRKVRGLRVVDASVYPRIPGTFTAVSTYMVAEKAADDILADAAEQ
ncbi:hypothetical protein VTG60DRAFT_1688 [Thermothelomyces hinnuleus]